MEASSLVLVPPKAQAGTTTAAPPPAQPGDKDLGRLRPGDRVANYYVENESDDLMALSEQEEARRFAAPK